MERPIFKPVGTPVAELDTPTLVLDLTLVEQNLVTLHTFFQQCPAKVRPYVTAHRCPTLAHKQLAAGGTVDGIGVSTVGEAEVFAGHGFDDILIANAIVSRPKIRRLCALARQTNMTVAVDNPAHVQALSEAATAAGVTLQVVVGLQTHAQGCGVAPGQPAVALAQQVHTSSHLVFAGLMSYAGPVFHADAARQEIQQAVDTRELVERAGLPVRIVSTGTTSNYTIAGSTSGVTEVLAGTYVLLDAHYAAHCPQFAPAARVLTTISSRPEPGTAIADAGQKAVSTDRGLPLVDLPLATVTSLSAEHCRLQLTGTTAATLQLGAQCWLTPYDLGTCINLYDYVHVARHDHLEAVWRVAARGQYR